MSRDPVVRPQAVRLLMLRRTLDILEASTKEARSVGELSQVLGLEIGKTWYRVRKLVDAGILVEVGKRKRAGRAEKLYQPSAKRFFIRSELRGSSIAQELNRALEESLAFGDHATGELFYFDGSRWRVENIYESGAKSEDKQHERWLIARLDASQREKLEEEVTSLFDKYSRAQQSSGKRTIVRFACASLPPELA